MKIWIILLTIYLAVGVLQKPVQYGNRLLAIESDEHSHSHEFSVEEVFELFWAGDVQHEHSHAEDSSHSHGHRHGLQNSSSLGDFIYSTFEFSYPEMDKGWMGLHSVSPKNPFQSEILRPPIRA